TFFYVSVTALFASPVLCNADTFDDAVNRYLEGFEHCNAAKEHLADGQLQKAAASLAKYRDITSAAVKLDPSIMNSNRRGMDSNLKYCQRVATEIEVSQGTPILNEAIAACDAAMAE